MKPGDYVIVENPADGMETGQLIRVRDVDGYGRYHLFGFDGPWNPERFCEAPTYQELADKNKNCEAALKELHAAIERGGLEVCIPDGLPMCEGCAAKHDGPVENPNAQPFTVEWLCEIGGELGHPQQNVSVVGFWSQHAHEWILRYSTLDGWSLSGRKTSYFAPPITTRGDVLKWLDVLGIVPKVPA